MAKASADAYAGGGLLPPSTDSQRNLDVAGSAAKRKCAEVDIVSLHFLFLGVRSRAVAYMPACPRTLFRACQW